MEHIILNAGECVIHLYCEDADFPETIRKSLAANDRLLKEGSGNWKNLSGPYRYRIDQAHDPNTGQRHIHVYKNGNELFSLNWNGRGHDNSSGVPIPKNVYDQLARAHPDLNLPKDRIIESMDVGGKMLKFSEYFKLRASDAQAMAKLNEAVELIDAFEKQALENLRG